jgi:hypothetical protein
MHRTLAIYDHSANLKLTLQQKGKTYKTGLYFLTLLCSMTAWGQGQITTTNLDTNKLPNGIKFTGKIKTAVRWTDKSGDNFVITTETGEMASKKEEPTDDFREAALYAYHYIVGKDSTILTWTVYDFIKDCTFDIVASFIKKTFQVTDLNNDGVAEVWLMYKTVCTSDVSPCDMKIIMYQGQQKYAMRGQNKVQYSDKDFLGGEYKFDNAFNVGAKEFREFAIQLWDKNIIHK